MHVIHNSQLGKSYFFLISVEAKVGKYDKKEAQLKWLAL